MRSALKYLIKAFISIGFFYILFTFVETNELSRLFHQVDYLYLILSILITWIMVMASCMKWKVILDMKGKKLSYWSLLKVYCIGYFFSNMLPSTIGGDVVRSYYVGNEIKNHAHSAVAIFIERFSGILLLFCLAMVMPLFWPGLYANTTVIIPALASCFFLILFLWLIFARTPLIIIGKFRAVVFSIFKKLSEQKAFSWLEKPFGFIEKMWLIFEGKLEKIKTELAEAAKTIKNDRKCLINIVLLTVLFYVLTWLNVYFSYKTFSVEVSLLLVCALTPTIMFAAHLPVTILGNIGYFESIFVYYFLLAGIPAEHSLAMGLLLRFKILMIGIIGFFIYMLYKKQKKIDDTFIQDDLTS